MSYLVQPDTTLIEPNKMVKSAERTIEILELIAASEVPLTSAQIHKFTGYPRSSLHWLLLTLVQLSWLELNPADSTYRVSARVLLCGTSYLDKDPTMQYVPLVLEGIRNLSTYTTHFARLEKNDVVYLATRQAADPQRLSSRVGRKLPATATALGKAILAEYTAAEIQARLGDLPFQKLTNFSVDNFTDLQDELEKVRETGFSTENQQNTIGVFCISAVVPYRIPATDAMSCSLPLDKATPEEVERVGTILKTAADDLAHVLISAGVR